MTFDYSNIDTTGIAIMYLGVFECDDWIYGNNTCENNKWVRRKSSIDFSSKKVWAYRDEVAGAYALAQFVCGNQECELEFGENAANCPTDCPMVGGGGTGGEGGEGEEEEEPPPEEEEEEPGPSPTPPPGGMIAVGGGGGAEVIAKVEESKPAYVEISKNSIEMELPVGEYRIVSLDILNNKATTLKVNTYIEGDIWRFIQIANPTFDVKAKQAGTLKMQYYTLPSSNVGIYTGDIVLKLDNEERKVATTLKVVPVAEALLDVKVTVLTPEIRPGRKLKYSTQLFNLGNTKKVDVWLP